MFKRISHGLIFLAFLFNLLAVTPPAPVSASADGKGISPVSLLNTDGSLNLDGNTRGALDLDGWNVQLDPARGPVFTPLAATDNWEELDASGGPFSSYVQAILIDGTNIYAGGWFQNAGGNSEADYIAMWNGSAWTALGSNGSGDGALSTSAVQDLWLSGSNLYVAGGFSTRDTSNIVIADAAKLAVWNGSVWSDAPGITSPINGTVYDFGFDSVNNILYFGGGFTNVNADGVADYIAGIDLDTSSLVTLGNDGSGGGSLNSDVYTVDVDSTGKVYAGGFFQNVNNAGSPLAEADYIAMWDGSNWSALGNTSPGVGAWSSVVGAIAIDGSNNVYAGGWSSNVAGIAEADYIAKWNGTAWSALGSNGAGDGAITSKPGGSVIQDIVINGSDIYAGGYLGLSAEAKGDYVAKFNIGTNTWSNLGDDGAGDGSFKHGVTDLAFSLGKLYAGGSFANVNNHGAVLPVADYFAIWDGTNWATLGDPNGSFTNQVKAIAVMGSNVYVGGSFANLTGDSRMDYLARWDGSAWNPVGNLTQSNGSINGEVFALVVDGADLYAGGNFTTASNEGISVTVNRVAKWNTLTSVWSALGGGAGSIVHALAVDASHNVYAGGAFTNLEAIPEADYVAQWNGSTWSALAGNGSGDGALNSTVFALAVNGANVYAGGQFTSVKDTSNTPIANAAYATKWNGSAWSALDGITSPLSGIIYAMTVSGSNLYIGGSFYDLNGMGPADRIAKWDGSAWSALGSNGSGHGSIGDAVQSIAVIGSQVYVGGMLTNVNNDGTILASADYVARWDGANWNAMGDDGSGNGSLGSSVSALAIIDNDLWVGGLFQNVNNGGTILAGADYLAVHGIDFTPPTVVSINRAEANPSAAAALDFTVTFSESVTGVDTTDFTVTKTGSVSGATVSAISGSGSSYTVTVNTGNRDGTIRLDLKASGTGIVDLYNNAIAGGFTSGQVYTINKTLTFRSSGANDGWVLESTETSGVGGTMESAATTFILGDGTADKQYRAILHFDTSSLPDTATITKVTLKIKKQGFVGTDPFTILGGLKVDMRRPSFGAVTLSIGDFQMTAGRTGIATFGITPVANWFSAIFSSSGRNYVNKTGTTQLRLRFATDDNNDNAADYMRFFSGNAGTGSRPQLIVEYYVP